jgi:hypothetical protein
MFDIKKDIQAMTTFRRNPAKFMKHLKKTSCGPHLFLATAFCVCLSFLLSSAPQGEYTYVCK